MRRMATGVHNKAAETGSKCGSRGVTPRRITGAESPQTARLRDQVSSLTIRSRLQHVSQQSPVHKSGVVGRVAIRRFLFLYAWLKGARKRFSCHGRLKHFPSREPLKAGRKAVQLPSRPIRIRYGLLLLRNIPPVSHPVSRDQPGEDLRARPA